MKTYKIILLALVSASFVILCEKNSPAYEGLGDAESEVSADQPNARQDFELMRFRDPATGMIPANIREKELEFSRNMPVSAHYINERSTDPWRLRGPFNVGGKTRALAMDKTDEKILLAGNTSGGIWRSLDGGATWGRSAAPNFINTSCIVQHPKKDSSAIWYAGTGELWTGSNGAFFIGNGIYKSSDRGVTWAPVIKNYTQNPIFDNSMDVIWNIAISPDTTQNMMFAAGYGGIYKSTNNGVSWAMVKGVTTAYSPYTDVAITPKGVIYATISSETSAKGIYRSTDGTTWTNITPSNWAKKYKRILIGVAPSDENQVYFLAETPDTGHVTKTFVGTTEYTSLWKYTYLSGSGNGTGGTWEDRSANLPSSGTATDQFYTQGSYDMVLKVKPNDPNIVFIGGTNLYRSDDGFTTATKTTRIGGYALGSGPPTFPLYPNHHPDQHNLLFYPSDPNKMISACDGGVFQTNDNTSNNLTWQPLNNGYVTTQFYTAAIEHTLKNDSTVIGGAQDNGSWLTSSNNGGASWSQPNGGDGSFCAIANGKNDFYFSSQNSKIVKAKLDASGNKTAFRRIDPIGGKGYQFVNPFVLDPSDNNIMYMAGGKYLWRNNDLGGIPLSNAYDSITTNWTKLSQVYDTAISALGISQTGHRMYVGTTTSSLYRIDGVNTGDPAKTDISGESFPPGYISCIAVDPLNADRAITVFSNYNVKSLFFTKDGGTTWEEIGGNLESSKSPAFAPACLWASILPIEGDTMYFVGTTTGLYASSHLAGKATIWTKQGISTIGDAIVTMIDTRVADGTVVVSTHGAGIYSAVYTKQDVIVNVSSPSVQKDIKISTYPNPASKEINFSFSIEKTKPVLVKIYNVKGELIKTIDKQSLLSGTHVLTVPTNDFVNGIYFCSISVGEYKQVAKVVVTN